MIPIPVHPPFKWALVFLGGMGDNNYLCRFFSQGGSSSKQLTSVKTSCWILTFFLAIYCERGKKKSNRPIHAELLMTNNGLLWYPFRLFTFEQKKALTLKVGILSTLECSRGDVWRLRALPSTSPIISYKQQPAFSPNYSWQATRLRILRIITSETRVTILNPA